MVRKLSIAVVFMLVVNIVLMLNIYRTREKQENNPVAFIRSSFQENKFVLPENSKTKRLESKEQTNISFGQMAKPNNLIREARNIRIYTPEEVGKMTSRAIFLAEQIPVPKRVVGVFRYTIERGDWVEEISRKFGIPLETLLAILQIQRDDIISDGDTLYLPIIEYLPRLGVASWYGPGFHGRQGANGCTYDQNGVSVAALHYPFNLQLEIERLDNKKKVSALVSDRGPYFNGRIVDLSKGAASELQMLVAGVIKVYVRPLNEHLDRIEKYRSRYEIAMNR